MNFVSYDMLQLEGQDIMADSRARVKSFAFDHVYNSYVDPASAEYATQQRVSLARVTYFLLLLICLDEKKILTYK